MKVFHIGLRRLCTVLLGLVFFVAGMLKLADPVGAGLVMDEYFKFFHLQWLCGLSKAAGVGMALVETLVGAALLAGIWRKWVALITAVMLAGFTVLTAVLLIFNPQMDCGCFGEAIHLTHLQTFLKNIVLCILGAAAFLPVKEYEATRKSKVIAFGVVALTTAVFTAHSLVSIPMVDFTEFAPGTSLAESDGTVDTQQEYTVIYEKDGVEQGFTLDNLPDSTWTFVRVDQTGIVLPDGTDAPAFFISDAGGEYRNELLTSGRVMVVTIYDSGRFKGTERTRMFIDNAEKAGMDVLVVSRDEVPGLESYRSDYKKIITLNRSNGGATLIDDGEIICKWPARSLPDADDLATINEKNSIELMAGRAPRGRIFFEGLMVYSLAVLLIL